MRQKQQKLFEPFEQAESGTNRKYGGTGLGLVIAKRIVELMDGRIWIESELGKGAKFIFTATLKSGGQNTRSLLDNGVNWDTVRILAVDDNPEITDQFHGVFEELGIRCDTAEDGREAERMIELNRGYDIYFVDWRMPGMDGIELTRLIKSHEGAKPNVVIMMVSASPCWGSSTA